MGRMTAIREMKPEDLAWVTELERLCFSDPWSETLLAEALAQPLDRLWVAEEEGRPAGYFDQRIGAGGGELMRIAGGPGFRGRGLGRKLMEKLAETARENGAQEITLEVRASNAPAIALYKSMGFQTEAVRKGYYASPAEDALIMWRRRG